MPMNDVLGTDSANAHLDDDAARVTHFGDRDTEFRAALTGDAVFDLRHLALVAADGEDVVEFLQGQLTNDIRAVDDTRAQWSAWCSPKGRVLTCLTVFRHAGRLHLELPRSLLDTTLQRLRMFVLRARVALEDVSDATARIGAVGDRVEARLREVLGTLPDALGDTVAARDLTVIRMHGPRARYQIVGEPADVAGLWNACRRVAAPAGADAWERLDIEAGIANIYPATSDAFVPQMINLDRTDGVSFTKGCYVGQEIVARTQHLGRIKRRMYRAHLEGAVSGIAPGDTLAGAVDDAPLRARVVDAKAADGGFELLAVMPTEEAEALEDAGSALVNGARLSLGTLPYTLTDETG